MVVSGRKALEDEMHFILECPLYSIDRIEIYDKLRIKPDTNTTDSLTRLPFHAWVGPFSLFGNWLPPGL